LVKTYKQYVESQNNQYQLLTIEGRSSGSYGNSETERPAGDPLSYSEIELIIPPNFQQYLLGLPVWIYNYGQDGSYHERWQYVDLAVEIPMELEDQLHELEAPLWRYNHRARYNKRPIVPIQIKFEGYKALIEHLLDELNINSYTLEPKVDLNIISFPLSPKPASGLGSKSGETSDQYWQRQIHTKGYLPKPKSQWEGD
jgi:hypothetical protein